MKSILVQLSASRETFLHTVGRFSELERVTLPVCGVWTVKDLIGHLSAWEEACLLPLRAFAQGQSFIAEDIPDHDAWNAVQSARRRDWPLQQVMDEYAALRSELVQLAEGMSETQWQTPLLLPWGEMGTVENMLSGLAWHESVEHLRALEK